MLDIFICRTYDEVSHGVAPWNPLTAYLIQRCVDPTCCERGFHGAVLYYNYLLHPFRLWNLLIMNYGTHQVKKNNNNNGNVKWNHELNLPIMASAKEYNCVCTVQYRRRDNKVTCVLFCWYINHFDEETNKNNLYIRAIGKATTTWGNLYNGP